VSSANAANLDGVPRWTLSTQHSTQELAEGFEPSTTGLQNRCSAVELR
jgi:hypothetical protein